MKPRALRPRRRRTCAATYATDGEAHDLEGFEQEINNVGSDDDDDDEANDKHVMNVSRSMQGIMTSVATNGTSEGGNTDELDDFKGEEEDIDSIGALIGLRRSIPRSACPSFLLRHPNPCVKASPDLLMTSPAGPPHRGLPPVRRRQMMTSPRR